jgi:hypothetical protein
MKMLRFASVAIVFAALNLFAQSAVPKPVAEGQFDNMKSFAGNWEGKSAMGDPVNVSFRLTSGGSALMSEIQTGMQGKSEDMISMIHMDGGRLLLTHYCAAGNQPRMQASASPDGKTITFDFVDATNLASPEDGHMQRVIFTVVSANHHIEEWHFMVHGKEMIQRFDLQKKS